MAAVPGAGLLALLRKRSEGSADGAGIGLASVATGGAPSPHPPHAPSSASKFEARSAAVHALEHAVVAGRVAHESRSVAQGRRIPPGPSYVYDVDVHAPHEAQPQLPVTPVTLINTDYTLQHYRQSAVSAGYLCYGLKQGHIRVLSRTSTVRALLKGHSKPVTDLQFAGADAGGGGDLLASGGQDGQLFVWQLRLDDDAGAIRESRKLRASFDAPAGAGGNVFLSWHSTSQRLLAVGVGGKVLLVGVPAEGEEELEFELGADSTPDATVLPDWDGEAVTCLSFSPDGQLLAAGGSDGTVRVWELRSAAAAPNGCPALVAQHSVAVPASTAGGPVGAVRWLPTPAGEGWVLLTGSRNCSTLQLWHAQQGGPGGAWAPLQTLRLDGKGGQQEFFVHVDLVPSQQLAILADTPRKAVYTLHWTGSGATTRFDYAARFGVAVPILSFTAAWSPAGGEQHDGPAVELTCVQTTAIQQYSLDPSLCYDGGEEAEADDGIVRRSSLLEGAGRTLQIHPQPSSAVPMPSAELASGTPRKQTTSPSVPAAAELAAAAPAAAEPAEAAVAEAAVPQAEASIAETVPLAAIPAPPAPEPPSPRGQSGEVTPEECPSPPPTPTEQLRLAQQAAAAAEVAAATAAAAAAAAEASVQSPPRLLTPSDLLLSASSSSVTTGRSSPATTASDSGRRGTPTAPAERSALATSRPVAPQPAAAPPRVLAAPLPAPAAAEPTEASALAAEEEIAALPSPSELPSPLAVTAAPAAAPAAATHNATVAAAVAEQMGGVHKKFVGHVSLMCRELLKAMKTEMAAQQQATARQLAAAMESQKQQVEAERAAVLADERASIERLLTAISTTLNCDLPAKLQEAVRGELAGMADGLAAGVAASVAPALQAAVAAALPKELNGAVKTGLDKQLGPAVSAGLGKPLQEAFRTAFTKQVVPAFENATQTMFQQINSAFASGLEEHLQASRAALGEPTGLASQLSASLSSAQQLAASLNQGHQQLLRAQSVAGTGGTRSPAAPVDVRAELAALLRSGKYEQAFSRALSMQDVATVGWLAAQADAASVLSREPCPLSQMVLLSLVQQLSADLTTNLKAKLAWIREAAMLVNPHDPVLARHVRPVLEGVHAALTAASARLTGADASSCRLAQHVVHSQLTS